MSRKVSENLAAFCNTGNEKQSIDDETVELQQQQQREEIDPKKQKYLNSKIKGRILRMINSVDLLTVFIIVIVLIVAVGGAVLAGLLCPIVKTLESKSH